MTQDELDRILERLRTDGEYAGWGLSRHRDYDVLFNSEQRTWRRFRGATTWIEVTGGEDGFDRPPH